MQTTPEIAEPGRTFHAWNYDDADWQKISAETKFRFAAEEAILTALLLKQLIASYGQWAMDTFKKANVASTLEHLKLEVAELERKPDDASEMADVVLLVMHLAHRQGLDLSAAILRKFEENKQRNWSEGQGGLYHHQEEASHAS